MFEKAALLFMYTLTPLHPGSGASVAAVDLPIQRERHTRFPMIQASGVKGGLRSLATALEREKKLGADGAKTIEVVFGPDTANASDHGGALSVTDARLCLFPVRAASGVFAWITCPAVIARLARDLELMIPPGDADRAPEAVSAFRKLVRELPTFDEEERAAVTPEKSSVVLQDASIVLEDFCFALKKDGRDKVGALAAWLAEHALPPGLDYWSEKLKTDLVLVGNDDFTYLVETCTEVITRVKLGEAGTVEAGPWDEEHLPSESLLYTATLAARPKAKNGSSSITNAQHILHFLRDSVVKKAPVTQLGGNGSVGRGLVSMRLFDGELGQDGRVQQGGEPDDS